jgi:hypothetical protein
MRQGKKKRVRARLKFEGLNSYLPRSIKNYGSPIVALNFGSSGLGISEAVVDIATLGGSLSMICWISAKLNIRE